MTNSALKFQEVIEIDKQWNKQFPIIIDTQKDRINKSKTIKIIGIFRHVVFEKMNFKYP